MTTQVEVIVEIFADGKIIIVISTNDKVIFEFFARFNVIIEILTQK